MNESQIIEYFKKLNYYDKNKLLLKLTDLHGGRFTTSYQLHCKHYSKKWFPRRQKYICNNCNIEIDS